jgi:hypothetical protein
MVALPVPRVAEVVEVVGRGRFAASEAVPGPPALSVCSFLLDNAPQER